MEVKKIISDYIDDNQDIFIKVSDSVWEYAEAGMREVKSAKCIEEALTEGGFRVTCNLADIPTAFVGVWGSGKPEIGFLGEFDALPGLSQQGCLDKKEPLTSDDGAYGHGCGHNLLGAGALAAAFALKDYLQKNNLPGTVKYFGCPGEEYGSGKAFMARAGCFDGVDACFTWHPKDHIGIVARGSLACYSAFFKFRGRTAHAAGAPHLGRSALDGCELMNVGVNYLREHVIPEARMHYAYRDVGGIAPNVVQDHAELHYFVRAPRVYQMMEILDRVKDIARGAALMSGTEVEFVTHEALSDFLPNDTLNEIAQKALEEVGAPVYSEQDMAQARRFTSTVSDTERESSIRGYKVTTGGNKPMEGPFNNAIPPLHTIDNAASGSTDVGDTSYCVPTVQFSMTTMVMGTPGHTWQITAQGKTGYAHKGMLTVAKAMALAAIYTMENPAAMERASAELFEKTGGKYNCPLPEEIKPTL